MFRTAISSPARSAGRKGCARGLHRGGASEDALPASGLLRGSWSHQGTLPRWCLDWSDLERIGSDWIIFRATGYCLFLGRMWIDKSGKTIVGNRTHLFWSFAGLENLGFMFQFTPICTPICRAEMAMSLAKPCGVRYAWMILGVSGQVGKWFANGS